MGSRDLGTRFNDYYNNGLCILHHSIEFGLYLEIFKIMLSFCKKYHGNAAVDTPTTLSNQEGSFQSLSTIRLRVKDQRDS